MKGNYFTFLVIAAIGVFALACKGKESAYQMVYLKRDSIQYMVDTLPSDIIGDIENGTHILKDKRGGEIMWGSRISGLKTGVWHYHTNDSLSLKVDWKIYDGDSIQINIPATWSVLKTKYFFLSTFATGSRKKKDKFFGVTRTQVHPDSMSLQEYVNEVNLMLQSDEVIKKQTFEIETYSGRIFYLIGGSVRRGDEVMLLLFFVGRHEGYIYDLRYSDLDENYAYKLIVFLDIITSLKLNGSHLFDPRDPIKTFRQI